MSKQSKNKKVSEVTRRILYNDPLYFVKKLFSSSGESSDSIGFIESVNVYPTKSYKRKKKRGKRKDNDEYVLFYSEILNKEQLKSDFENLADKYKHHLYIDLEK